MSINGRISNLGNTIQSVAPKDVLPSLHMKTYFKATETLNMNLPSKNTSLNVTNDMKVDLRVVDENITIIKPDEKSFEQLDLIRFDKFRK